MADGAVGFVSNSVSIDTWQAMATIAGTRRHPSFWMPRSRKEIVMTIGMCPAFEKSLAARVVCLLLLSIAVGLQSAAAGRSGCSHRTCEDRPAWSTMVDDFAQRAGELKLTSRDCLLRLRTVLRKDLPRYAITTYEESRRSSSRAIPPRSVVIGQGRKDGQIGGRSDMVGEKGQEHQGLFERADSASGKARPLVRDEKAGREIWKLTDAPLPAK